MQLETLRQIMSKFATGVTVVTTKQGDGIHGLMVKAFTAVLLEPPLILICVQKKGSIHACISQNERFLVNILSDAQKDLAERFANPQLGSLERVENVASRLSSHGDPILAGNVGFRECRTVNTLDAGDHTIFLARMEKAEIGGEERPLTFFDRRFASVK